MHILALSPTPPPEASGDTAVVAWIALFIAALSLIVTFVGVGWTIFDTQRRRPHLRAELNKTTYAVVNGPPGAKSDLHVTAINMGSEAATVWDVGLKRFDGVGVTSVRNARANGRDVEGPTLPARIESHGTLTWTFPDDLTKDQGDHVELFGWVSRIRPLRKVAMSEAATKRRTRQWLSGKLPRKLQKSSIEETRSSRPTVRGNYKAPT